MTNAALNRFIRFLTSRLAAIHPQANVRHSLDPLRSIPSRLLEESLFLQELVELSSFRSGGLGVERDIPKAFVEGEHRSIERGRIKRRLLHPFRGKIGKTWVGYHAYNTHIYQRSEIDY